MNNIDQIQRMETRNEPNAYCTILEGKLTPHAVSMVTEYTKIGGDEELPLGEEFQEHLKRFLRPSEKKVPKKIELVRKIVDQLA